MTFNRKHIRIAGFLATLILIGCSDDNSENYPTGAPIDLINSIAFELNPNEISPLTATVSVITKFPTKVSVEVLGDQPIAHNYEVLKAQQEVDILGLYPDTVNAVQITVTTEKGNFDIDTLLIQTTLIPDGFPDITIDVLKASAMEEGLHFSELTLANNGSTKTMPIIFDNDGQIRWYLDLNSIGIIGVAFQGLPNGNLLFGNGSNIQEFSMMGENITTVHFDDYSFHHDLIEMPDGNLLVAVNKHDETYNYKGEEVPVIEDHFIHVDRLSGQVLQEWDFKELLDIDRHDLIDLKGDWFHQNSIWYDESDNSLIASGRHQGVVKLSWENELKWILAPHSGWGKAGPTGEGFETSEFLLTAIDNAGNPYPDAIQSGTMADENFDWPWGQHAAMILDNGNIFLFDNGLNRQFGNAAGNYSRAVEYKINEEDMTVQQVWSYGEQRTDAFSFFAGDVDILPKTQNRLFMPAYIRNGASTPSAKIVEVTYPEGEVVFEATLNLKELDGDGTGIGQVDFVYRSERMLLYF